ncbi:Minor extracellular protease vpr, partial [Choanephora cucurbitarum]
MKPSLFAFPGLAMWACLALTSLVTEAAELKHAKLMSADYDAIAGRYIVQFKKNNSLAGKTFAHSVQQALSNNGVEIKETINHRIFSGASIDITDVGESALKPILDREDVEAIYPVRRIYHASTSGVAPSVKNESYIGKRLFAEKRKTPEKQVDDFNIPLVLGQVDQVHSKLGYKGKGILVGIIDSVYANCPQLGLDYMHPALGGGFGKGYKVVAGYDLVGDAFDFDMEPQPDADPYDSCSTSADSISDQLLCTPVLILISKAHATHIAGIIAGYSEKQGFTGVAPEASLGIWRVFGCQGSTSSDMMIKAMLMAYDAGVDIISMSISYNYLRYGYGGVEAV